LPGLDEFYKFIEKQEKQQTTLATRESEGAATEGRVNDAASGESDGGTATRNGTGKSANGVRYVLRNGMTVPVEGTETEDMEGAVYVNGTGANGTNGTAAVAGTTLEDTVAMWGKLPRHIQLLASIEVPDREEVAQKYYTRGFRESRQELIERLLNPTLTLEETARVLGVCPATVRRYTNRGVLPHYRTVGQQRRFRLSDVLTFLDQQQHERGSNGGRGNRRDAA
jgi:excisionase family DNA binding protein